MCGPASDCWTVFLFFGQCAWVQMDRWAAFIQVGNIVLELASNLRSRDVWDCVEPASIAFWTLPQELRWRMRRARQGGQFRRVVESKTQTWRRTKQTRPRTCGNAFFWSRI